MADAGHLRPPDDRFEAAVQASLFTSATIKANYCTRLRLDQTDYRTGNTKKTELLHSILLFRLMINSPFFAHVPTLLAYSTIKISQYHRGVAASILTSQSIKRVHPLIFLRVTILVVAEQPRKINRRKCSTRWRRKKGQRTRRGCSTQGS